MISGSTVVVILGSIFVSWICYVVGWEMGHRIGVDYGKKIKEIERLQNIKRTTSALQKGTREKQIYNSAYDGTDRSDRS